MKPDFNFFYIQNIVIYMKKEKKREIANNWKTGTIFAERFEAFILKKNSNVYKQTEKIPSITFPETTRQKLPKNKKNKKNLKNSKTIENFEKILLAKTFLNLFLHVHVKFQTNQTVNKKILVWNQLANLRLSDFSLQKSHDNPAGNVLCRNLPNHYGK